MSLTPLEQLSAVFVISAVGCLLVGHRAIRALRALQWLQPTRHEDCPPLLPLHQSKEGTPTMGGLVVLGVAVTVAILWGGVSHLEGRVVLGTVVSLAALGFIDDILKFRQPGAKGLRCVPKLLVALAVGVIVGQLLADPQLGYRQVALPWLAQRWTLEGWWIPSTAVVIAGCAHAVNLTDGMDGLAVGCLALAFVVLGVWSVTDAGAQASPIPREASVWCASFAGACIGFLWFNSFPASVFLGDVGALGLGAGLGVLALLSQTALGLVIIGGVFVAEAVSVMLQVASYRWRNKRRLFRVAPLHHHFQVGGVSEQKLVVRFWIIGILLAALGLSAFSHS